MAASIREETKLFLKGLGEAWGGSGKGEAAGVASMGGGFEEEPEMGFGQKEKRVVGFVLISLLRIGRKKKKKVNRVRDFGLKFEV